MVIWVLRPESPKAMCQRASSLKADGLRCECTELCSLPCFSLATLFQCFPSACSALVLTHMICTLVATAAFRQQGPFPRTACLCCHLLSPGHFTKGV
eukprot:1160964-Pelagomonas_calceolata.AAC.1